MSRRISPLSPILPFAALLAIFLTGGAAYAHRLDAQAFLLPNRQVQIEGWFTNGEAAKNARVQVFGAQEQLIAEGQLDQQGVFIFSLGSAEQLRVVISAGAGHRKELSISSTALAPAMAATEYVQNSPAPGNAHSPVPIPLAERNPGFPVKDTLIGVGFLLAVAAFVLSLRNAKKLRALGRLNEKAR